MLPPRANPMVYILNPDPSTRNWIEAIVTSAGLHALSFDLGSELLAQVTPDTMACAILDVNLPDGSGLAFQAALARGGIPSMFLTRERCMAYCVQAVKAGAVDYLTMPCNALSVVRALRDAVQLAARVRHERVHCDDIRSRYERLTPREREVFALVSSGLRNKQIAHQLSISQITVQIHRGQVMRKMAARSFASLVRMSDTIGKRPGHSR